MSAVWETADYSGAQLKRGDSRYPYHFCHTNWRINLRCTFMHWIENKKVATCQWEGAPAVMIACVHVARAENQCAVRSSQWLNLSRAKVGCDMTNNAPDSDIKRMHRQTFWTTITKQTLSHFRPLLMARHRTRLRLYQITQAIKTAS